MANIPQGGKSHDAIVLFFKSMSEYPHLAEVGSIVQEKEQLSASLASKIKAKQALLDEIKAVGELGLRTKELLKLHNLLMKLGASQCKEVQEATNLFFDYVVKFQDAVTMDYKIQQLQTAIKTHRRRRSTGRPRLKRQKPGPRPGK